MHLELTDDEREILLRLLEHEIAETGPEIRHTRTYDYRDELKAYKKNLRSLADRLRTVQKV